MKQEFLQIYLKFTFINSSKTTVTFSVLKYPIYEF